MPTQIHFRAAQASDSKVAVDLIYSSGSAAFEYGFSTGKYQAIDFLSYTFTNGRGFFGWKNHTVAILNNEVVGIGAFYNGQDYVCLSMALVWQVLCFYPFNIALSVFWRLHQLQNLMPPPAKNSHYVANFAVRADRQNQHIGTALLSYQQAIGKQRGRVIYTLDVSVENLRAQALYERFGFKALKIQKFNGKTGRVADTRRMEMPL